MGIGKAIKYEDINIVNNIKLVHPFNKYESAQTDAATSKTRKRSDRLLKSFFFCPNEFFIDTFESEEELSIHLLSDQHTTKETSLRSNDKTKMILFDKIRNDSMSLSTSSKITSISISNEVPRRYQFFTTQGWALRKRKPSTAIDRQVKALVKSIFDEERKSGMTS